MPILTPAYPCMNSSYNVGRPQLRRIQHELRRTELMVAAVSRGEQPWDFIFRESDFFRQHAHYLQVNIIARNQQDFRCWFGLCESKLRILIVCLESPGFGIEAYPFSKFFHQKHDKKYSSSFFIALRFAHGVENVDLKSCTSEFLYKVNAWDQRQCGMDLTIEHKLQQNLPHYVFNNSNCDKRHILTAPIETDPSPAKRARKSQSDTSA